MRLTLVTGIMYPGERFNLPESLDCCQAVYSGGVSGPRFSMQRGRWPDWKPFCRATRQSGSAH